MCVCVCVCVCVGCSRGKGVRGEKEKRYLWTRPPNRENHTKKRGEMREKVCYYMA